VLPGAGKYKPAGSSCSGEWNRKYRITTSSAGGSGKWTERSKEATQVRLQHWFSLPPPQYVNLLILAAVF